MSKPAARLHEMPKISPCSETCLQFESRVCAYVLEDRHRDSMIPAPTKAIKLVHSSISAMLYTCAQS